MKRSTLFLCAFLIGPRAAVAQGAAANQRTTTPDNAKFEIVQSPLTTQWTFRLDRFSGHVSLLTKGEAGQDAWTDMEIGGLPDKSDATGPHFQIFISGLVAEHLFLIDTDTGMSWILAKEKKTRTDGSIYEADLWRPFAH